MADISVFFHLTRPAAVLRATGPDAFSFLQSQFSNELNNPDIEHPVTYGLWLDLKGKIQADSFIIQKSPEDFVIMSYDCPAAKIRAHLDAHLIADEVELSDETAALGLLHVWADARGIVEMMEATDEQIAATAWLGRRPVYNALDFLLPPPILENFSHVLAENGAEPVSADELLALRIVAGIPAVPLDAGPGDLPQEVGLQHDGVSFEKGCYLGQEVMARLHSQGHVNRGLWQVAWRGQTKDSGTHEPVPLYAGQEPAGELRSRVTQDGRGLGLAMLKNRIVAGKKALSLSAGGPEIIDLVRGLTVP